MTLPSLKEIEQLHRKYAPNEKAFNEIWEHCQIVKQIALWCIANTKTISVNKELVEAGALLHDIGVYKLYTDDKPLEDKNYIQHGVLGYELLKQEGFSEEICRFGSHHTGVGITADDITKNRLPLPVADYLAETNEERLVMYADKFHSKDPNQFNSVIWFKDHLAKKFGQAKVLLFNEMLAEFGKPPIDDIAKTYRQTVR